MTLSGRVKFSKWLPDAARVEHGFFESEAKHVRFSLFRFRIFAYSVHGRLSQPFPSFLSQLGGGMQSEFLFHAHLMCLNRFDAYMAAIRLPSDVLYTRGWSSLATMAGDAASDEAWASE